jgi:catechol 2,3-dioxygenase-like lactoylglutathione lyase family enzyme
MTAAHPFIDQQLTFIYTKNLPESSAFLRDVLGLELVLDQFGICHIYRVTATSFLGVCTNREPPENPGLTYSLVVKDVDEAYETLKSRGVVFEAPPKHSEKFNVYSCFFRGIESYRFEIQQFMDSSWPQA